MMHTDLDKWFTSDEDLRRVLALDEWRAAFADVPGLPHVRMPAAPPPLRSRRRCAHGRRPSGAL
eukprot:3176627-Prymnesium_polylepis.1